MKLTSAGANKMIKAWNEDLEGLLKKEEAESRTTYGINEEPLPANYDFARMQQQMDALNQKIAVLRHAVNVFNTTTMLEGFGFTIDEALVRMAMLTKKKQRLAQMKQVPLLVRTSPGYGSNTPEMTCRNYDAEQVEQELNALYGDKVTVFRSEPFFVEIMPKNVHKATSLEKLLKYLDMDVKDLIACGDGFNDLTMIEYAGVGVAMGNAQQIVKDHADYITLTNDEDGLVPVIEKFILNS